MKAIVLHEYGSPDVLRYADVDAPTPGDDDVLVKVCAASINPYDWHGMRGEPMFIRLFSGLSRPKFTRIGVDLAGEVVAVGSHVTEFKAGDAVVGTAAGSLAEYVCAPERRLAIKPAPITFEQAASVPVAGAFTALQGLRDKANVQPGHKVLINGASGGVGTFATQIAKALGAETTGVCSTRNVGLVQSLGADHVVDYTRHDFTASAERYDVIFDCIGNHSPSACARLLTPTGIYMMVGGPDGQLVGMLARLLITAVRSRLGGRKKAVLVLGKQSRELLGAMMELMAAGKVTAVIDRRYTLRETAEAMRYLETKHARGKVVVTPG